MDGEPAEVRDPAAPVALLELHHPGELPVLLDHEDAELGRLTQGALDPLERRLAPFRPDRGEERRDLLVVDEGGDEVGVGRLGPRMTPSASTTSPRTKIASCAGVFVLGFVSRR